MKESGGKQRKKEKIVGRKKMEGEKERKKEKEIVFI